MKFFPIIKKSWFKFSKDWLSVLGLIIVLATIILALLAPIIAPHPQHAGRYVNFSDSHQPPSSTYILGTDEVGRDIFSRILHGYRFALIMGVVVLGIAVPPGVILGLIAGYYKDSWLSTIIMRITDIFLSIPPLVLALTIASVLTPNLRNSMLAITVMWWPWYTRLTFSITSSVKNEFFILSAEVIGASKRHILLKEIFPNCIPSVFTKMSLDMGWVIIMGASLSFVGLGVQPPRPGLGTMVANGIKHMPHSWWIAIFPGIAIAILVLGLNLLGDGIRDLLGAD